MWGGEEGPFFRKVLPPLPTPHPSFSQDFPLYRIPIRGLGSQKGKGVVSVVGQSHLLDCPVEIFLSHLPAMKKDGVSSSFCCAEPGDGCLRNEMMCFPFCHCPRQKSLGERGRFGGGEAPFSRKGPLLLLQSFPRKIPQQQDPPAACAWCAARRGANLPPGNRWRGCIQALSLRGCGIARVWARDRNA